MKLHLLTSLYVAWWAVVLNAGPGLLAHAVYFVAPDGRDAVLHDLGIFALLIRAVFFRGPILVIHEPSN